MDTRFDRWADTYDRSFMQRRMFGPVHRAVLDLCARQATEPKSILDVGCGTGRLLEMAAFRWPGASLTGVDYSGAMVAQARSKHEGEARFAFEQGDSAALPRKTACFDAAFSTVSFHHWANQEAGLKEVARVLKPGGIFVLADIELPFSFPIATIFNLIDKSQVRTRKELGRMLEQAGFSVLESRGLWAMMRVRIIAAKVSG